MRRAYHRDLEEHLQLNATIESQKIRIREQEMTIGDLEKQLITVSFNLLVFSRGDEKQCALKNRRKEKWAGQLTS